VISPVWWLVGGVGVIGGAFIISEILSDDDPLSADGGGEDTAVDADL
jgi:hypothetical protein